VGGGSFSTVGMVEGSRGLASMVGGLDKSFLQGVTMSTLNGTIPEALWVLFQMTFAVITPALMVGSFVERMKFNAVMWYALSSSPLVSLIAPHATQVDRGGKREQC
jgi:ammonia channel protein AmtB